MALPSSSTLPANLKDLEYQFKVLANIPAELPFCADTAQDIIDLYALQVTPNEETLAVLVQALKDQGADDTKTNAALIIWQNNVNLHILRQIGARCNTAEALKEAVYALVQGTKDSTGSEITESLRARLSSSIRTCLAEPTQTQTASQNRSKDVVKEARADHDKIPKVAEQNFALDRKEQRKPPEAKSEQPEANSQTNPPGISTAQKPFVQPRSTEKDNVNGVREQKSAIVDQNALNQLIAESSAAQGPQTTLKQNGDSLSLLEETLNSENNKQQSDTTSVRDSKPAHNQQAQAVSAPINGLKTKDMATARPLGGSLPPTPVSAISPKTLHCPASAIDERNGSHRSPGQQPADAKIKEEQQREESPSLFVSPHRTWPSVQIDSYRPGKQSEEKPHPLDVPLSERISAREPSPVS